MDDLTFLRRIKRMILYNFITWYNSLPKDQRPQDGLITTTIIEKYLN